MHSQLAQNDKFMQDMDKTNYPDQKWFCGVQPYYHFEAKTIQPTLAVGYVAFCVKAQIFIVRW